MTKAEAREYAPGIYLLYWKRGGTSLAAVGVLHDGRRWFAPTNWTGASALGIGSTEWRMVDHVVQIRTDAP